MLSSTFTDLKEHRQKAKTAIEKLDFHAVGMESGGAQVADVIEASLNYVRDSAAYIGIITRKYGQTPHDPERNPDRLSITELEFNEAVRLKRPILLFIMDKAHKGTEDDFEFEADKRAKLAAFTARAKLIDDKGEVERVWETFVDTGDFAAKVGPAVAKLARSLETPGPTALASEPMAPPVPELPRAAAPALRALPSYLGSHDFVGRSAELDVLDDWASSADTHPVLLFEAMGGTGKSMLTWHWLNERAPKIRTDWAGRFWYSFYEQGATLAGFCREALSYMTGVPVKAFGTMRPAELAERLLAELDRNPWLLVLDGLERILVGYQRSDAAQVRDEDVETIRDPLANRDPCLAIRPEDDELLRRFAAADRSKILISTRLTPAKLINKSGRELSGVKRELLKGLRPVDAEKLFIACGVRGESEEIQRFLQANCDGHPLVIGVLAGLVNNYIPDRSNFAAWRDDPAYGGKLDWSAMNLVQSRNHILDEAIAALDEKSLQLLQGLALLIGGADYPLLEAINPHLPPKPGKVPEPSPPFIWEDCDEEEQAGAEAVYQRARERYEQYINDLASWQASAAVEQAAQRLSVTVLNLEKRGLLQYDADGHRYDLHPVVRGVASSRMSGEEHANSGSRVIDYCRAASPDNWDHAQDLQDMALGRQLVATLTRIGRFDEAMEVYRGNFSNTLFYRLEKDAEMLSLVRDFFPLGWNHLPAVTSANSQSYLINDAAILFSGKDRQLSKTLSENSLVLDLKNNESRSVCTGLANLAIYYDLSTKLSLYKNAIKLANLHSSNTLIYANTIELLSIESILGNNDSAEELWKELSSMKKPPAGAVYRPGQGEYAYAAHCFRNGHLSEAILAEAEQAASGGSARHLIRDLATLRGRWLIDQGQARAAISTLQHAIAMARQVGKIAPEAEAALTLARLRNGDAEGARADADSLDEWDGTAALYVSRVWLELGERERAVAAALRAHESAIDDGEPFVYRWLLDNAREILGELDAPLPELKQYDPTDAPTFDWEPDFQKLIARLETEKAKREAEEASSTAGEDAEDDDQPPF